MQGSFSEICSGLTSGVHPIVHPGYSREAAEEEAAEPLSPVARPSFRALAARGDATLVLIARTWGSRLRRAAGKCRPRRALTGRRSRTLPVTSSSAR
eukprot:301393-Alexandrium_andersonii.AAC.1